MKRFALIFILAVLSVISKAQIAKWLIPQNYDSMQFEKNADVIIADSAEQKILFSNQGARLASTKDLLLPYSEGYAVVIDNSTKKILGFYDLKGKKTDLPNLSCSDEPALFHSGYLLAKDDNKFVFYDASGKRKNGVFEVAKPFINGFATCVQYANVEKLKDPYKVLKDSTWNTVQFVCNGKTFDNDDIEFISSVNDEGLAFLVVKHKVYTFNANTRSTTQLLYNVAEPKSQAKLKEDLSLCLKKDGSQYILSTMCGKKDIIEITFDNMLRPLSVQRDGTVDKEFKVKTTEDVVRPSVLTTTHKGNLYGIAWNGEQMLDEQFDNAPYCFEDKAIVSLKGKKGLLKIDKESKFQVKLNKGDDIAFSHQKKSTTIRVNLPVEISAKKTYLEMLPESGCDIDKLSRMYKDTENGNYIEYSCDLRIPQSLTDDISEIEYPFCLEYNGLRTPILKHKQKAWYVKKYDIEEDETKQEINNGTLTIVFNIKDVKPDNEIFPLDINVSADTLKVEREDKMSEMRYKYRVYNLSEGTNHVTVKVIEQGCPPATFLYDVEYNKPVIKTHKSEGRAERVVIRKKGKDAQKESKEPDIKI